MAIATEALSSDGGDPRRGHRHSVLRVTIVQEVAKGLDEMQKAARQR